jgi:hypothetical protein
MNVGNRSMMHEQEGLRLPHGIQIINEYCMKPQHSPLPPAGEGLGERGFSRSEASSQNPKKSPLSLALSPLAGRGKIVLPNMRMSLRTHRDGIREKCS